MEKASDGSCLQSLTTEEANRLVDAMKDPKFASMFAEYMKEISDPKARRENDLYLQQLEQEQSLPEGMKLLKPSPFFCLKAQHSQHGKLFVNVCTSELIDRPYSQKCDGGINWNFPYSCSKERTISLAKTNQSARVVDVTFHTHICTINDDRVRKLIECSALEGAEKVIGVIFARPYRILQKVKCQDGPPALIRIGGSEKPDWKMPPSLKLNPHQTPRQTESVSNGKQGSSGDGDHDKKESIIDTKSEIKPKPKFEIIHRGKFQMQDCTVSTQLVRTTRPQALVVKIHIPEVDCLSTRTDVVLDAQKDQIVFEIKGLYSPLHIKFPYEVDHEAGTAKFNSSERVLTVTLKLLQSDSRVT